VTKPAEARAASGATPAAAVAAFPLEPDGAQMRALVDAAMDRIVAHVESLPEQKIYDVEDAAAVAASLRAPVPERGRPLDELLAIVFDRAAPKSFGTPMPGYLAYIPGGGLFHSAVADLIGDTLNRYTGVWQAAPALVELEANVLRWLAAEVGYGAAARGFLTTGGSLANLSALVVARRAKLPDDFLRGTIYTSDQVHHSLQKAAMVAGLPADNVRALPADEHFRLDPAAVEAAIAADRARGMQPFFLVASAGTVNTGAVDPLPALADLAAREGLWLHVDGAYGGCFVLTERGKTTLAGIERADSVTLDPHKGLFLPYGTGCLLVKDGEALARAHALHAAYLPERPPGADWWDFSELSPELSRPFRGLRLWLPLMLCGATAFREALDEKLDLARWAADEVVKIPHLRLVAPPELSLLAFRLEPPGTTRVERDRLNRDLLARVAARQRVLMTGTDLDDGFVGRICVLSFRTHRDRMEMGLEDLRAAVAEVMGAFATR
jgi:aromatic-L-amino-acid/L-tryptophan decarboxylase